MTLAIILIVFLVGMLGVINLVAAEELPLPQGEDIGDGHTLTPTEMITLAEYIEELRQENIALRQENKALKDTIELERLAHDRAMEQAEKVIQSKEDHIDALKEHNNRLQIELRAQSGPDIIKKLILITAGIGLSTVF